MKITECVAGVNGECGRPAFSKGMCQAHYNANRQGKPTDYEIREWGATPKECSVDDCGDPVLAKGMCHLHYYRNRYGRDVEALKPSDKPTECEYCGKAVYAKSSCHRHYLMALSVRKADEEGVLQKMVTDIAKERKKARA